MVEAWLLSAARLFPGLVVVVALVACSAPQPAQVTPSGTTAGFNDFDVEFAQAMIPHGEQAADMSALLLEETGLDPAVQSVASKLVESQQKETAQFQQWLTTRGAASTGEPRGSHHGGGEDGTATVDQMRALDRAKGAAAEALYVKMMLKHHGGAVEAARDELEHGQSVELISLGRQIIHTRETELTILRRTSTGQTPPIPGLTPPSGNVTPR